MVGDTYETEAARGRRNRRQLEVLAHIAHTVLISTGYSFVCTVRTEEETR